MAYPAREVEGDMEKKTFVAWEGRERRLQALKKERNTWLGFAAAGAAGFLSALALGAVTGNPVQFLVSALFAWAAWKCAKQFREKNAAMKDAAQEKKS